MRLDKYLLNKKLVTTRSQGESYVRMGKVKVNGQTQAKPGYDVREHDRVKLVEQDRYVSRAGHKLASVAEVFDLNFKDKIVLDVGSSTGGFTDYALQHGAKKVYAVDVGTNQLHQNLREDGRVELHEKTDIRDYAITFKEHVDVVVIDVSFISLREVLPSIKKIAQPATIIVAMVKPQFEAGSSVKHKGIIKNNSLRRDILKKFEQWASGKFIIVDKSDSKVSGSKGNTERFYVLRAVGSK